MTTAKLFGRDVTASEYKLWTGILRDYQDNCIEWAFDTWNRNGKFFPKPAEILELIHSFGSSTENQTKLCGKCLDGFVITNPEAKPSDYVMRRCECVESAIAAQKLPVHRCDRECQSRHGKGYDLNDVLWLFKKRKASPKAKWTEADYLSAMDELDKMRQGGKPQWRQA